MEKDTRVRETLLPVRIVKTFGNVEKAESLLREKPLQITIAETDCTTLTNGAEGEEAAVILDFGKELHGALRVLNFRSKGCQYADVHITLGESVAEAMSCVGQKNATNDHAIRDFDWVMPSYSDMVTNESGFRFACIRLKGKDVSLHLKSVVAVRIYHDLEYKGSFRCDDDRLNEIFDTAAYTCHLCTQNYIWDGIKRDRLVWVGDMHPEVLAARSVFGVIPQVEKTMNFIRENTPLPNWMNTYPTYSAWWLIIVKDWYLYSGNEAFLEENREYILGLTKQIADHIHSDGSDTLPRYFLDWPCHYTPAEIPGSRAILAIAMEAGGYLADLLGDTALAASCKEKKAAMLSVPADGCGAKQATAMLYLAGWGEEKQVAEEILADGAKGWSTFMSYYLLQAAKSNMAGALEGLKTYYGAMLDLGATSFWEDFDLDWVAGSGRIDEVLTAEQKDIHGDRGAFCYQGYRHSLCHGWSSAPTAFLLEEVAGIQIQEAGCKEIAVKPNLGNLTWVEATYPTPYGIIRVSHKKNEKGEVETKIDAPKEITVRP